ncbi:hypothetical protein D3C84_1034020 [compost metagenome]
MLTATPLRTLGSRNQRRAGDWRWVNSQVRTTATNRLVSTVKKLKKLTSPPSRLASSFQRPSRIRYSWMLNPTQPSSAVTDTKR